MTTSALVAGIACALIAPLPASAAANVDWSTYTESGARWTRIAASDDGATIYGTSGQTTVRKSTDSGKTWTKLTVASANQWTGWMTVDTDNDGSTVVLGSSAGQAPKLSQDGGASWTSLPVPTTSQWSSVELDDDGSTVVLASYDNGVWISTNGGASFTKNATIGEGDWRSVRVSDDGKTLAAASYWNEQSGNRPFRPGRIMVSTDAGATWTARGTYDTTAQYTTLDLSADGKSIVAASSATGAAYPYGPGQLYISHDAGVTFTTSPQGGNFSTVSIDDDGSSIIASGDYRAVSVSTDGGATWLSSAQVGTSSGNDVSGNGSLFVAAGTNQLHTGALVTRSAPKVTTEPADQQVAVGGEITFTVATSGTPAPTLQWQSSADGTTWADLTGETGTSLTLSGVASDADGTRYRAVITNSEGTEHSRAALLAVGDLPTATGYWPTSTISAGYFFELAPEVSGLGPIDFRVSKGLPDELEFDWDTGVISGTLTETGTWTATVTVSSPIGSTEYPVTITANDPSPWAQVLFANDIVPGAELADGLMVLAEGGDLKPGSDWTVELSSVPVTLDAGVAPAAYSGVGGEYELPETLEVGSHRIAFTGTGFYGDPIAAEAWFAVDAAGVVFDVSYEGPVALPTPVAVPVPVDASEAAATDAEKLANTGVETLPVVAGGALALLLGAVLVVGARLRRRSA